MDLICSCTRWYILGASKRTVKKGRIQHSLPSVLSFVQGQEIRPHQISSSLVEIAQETRPMTKSRKEQRRAVGSKLNCRFYFNTLSNTDTMQQQRISNLEKTKKLGKMFMEIAFKIQRSLEGIYLKRKKPNICTIQFLKCKFHQNRN